MFDSLKTKYSQRFAQLAHLTLGQPQAAQQAEASPNSVKHVESSVSPLGEPNEEESAVKNGGKAPHFNGEGSYFDYGHINNGGLQQQQEKQRKNSFHIEDLIVN